MEIDLATDLRMLLLQHFPASIVEMERLTTTVLGKSVAVHKERTADYMTYHYVASDWAVSLLYGIHISALKSQVILKGNQDRFYDDMMLFKVALV